MTFSELADLIQKSFNPGHNVHKLNRTWNIHPWLSGNDERPVLEKHWKDITEAQQFVIQRCNHKDDGERLITGVALRAAESSSGPYGPKQYPLHNLPLGRPDYNEARPIFSRWERDEKGKQTGRRTTNERAMSDFENSKKMICDPEGPCWMLR